ncbi:MAG: trypsin-like peptidase domain-containing protein, partial [Rhodanobacteraceae bacterium]
MRPDVSDNERVCTSPGAVMSSVSRIRRSLHSLIAVAALALASTIPAMAGTLPVAVNGQQLPSLAPMLASVSPAVVNISSTSHRRVAVNPFFSDPVIRQFFGLPVVPPSRELVQQSLGSGVIVDAAKGYILTNNHVVAGASDVEVFTLNRRKYRARIIGTDQRTDIAVLKIDASGLPVFTLGDSAQLKVGDIVFAIGDPFGIGETATMGIVSATGRALGGSIEHYENFIQTDAAINPGNSGGAMIDLHGNLVGINTAIISGGGGGNEGIGFAIPIDMARQVMDQ